jgi:hypothetical protein
MGEKYKIAAGGLFFKIARDSFVDGKARDQDVQKSRRIRCLHVDGSHDEIVQAPVLEREAVGLRGETRGGGAHHIQLIAEHLATAEGGDHFTPRVRHKEQRVRLRRFRPHLGSRVLDGCPVVGLKGRGRPACR